MMDTIGKNEQGRILLHIARNAICRALRVSYVAMRMDDGHMAWLSRPGATFVTLTQYGELRGCIGCIWPLKPLIEAIIENVVAACSRD